MSTDIHWRASAKHDLYIHAEYLRVRSLESAERFIAAVDKACGLLAVSPQIGGLIQTRQIAHEGIRVWSVRDFRNYLLFYRNQATGIEIVRIMHGAQDWTQLVP